MPLLNYTGRGVDDVYINVFQPQPVLTAGGGALNGCNAGLATWGPYNSPLNSNTPQAAIQIWGPPLNSGADIVQDVALFLKQQPGGGVTSVRVPGIGAAQATGTLKDTTASAGAAATAFYFGSFGSQVKISIALGSNSSSGAQTWKVSLQVGNSVPEIYDRIPGNTAAAAWTNIINAVNNGINSFAPSLNATLAQPGTVSAAFPAVQTITLTGGADGTVPASAAFMGVDGGSGSRTGLYAARGTGADLFWLCGNYDSTIWSTLLAFAKSEGAGAISSFPKGTSVATAVTQKLTAGIDDPYMVLLLGWVQYLDTYFNANVWLPPTAVAAGIIESVAPHQSPGNRQAYGIIGTEQTLQGGQPFSYTDLGTLEANGINCISLPIPAANAFGLRHGKNTSSNFATSEIPYARKTNAIIRDLSGTVMGQFVNRLQTTSASDPLRAAVEAALNDYFGPQVGSEINSYSVTCDLSNNPIANIIQGRLQADVIVEYQAVVDQFVINLTAGQTVDVQAASASNTPALQ